MVYTRRLADPNLKEDLPFRHYTLKHHLIACAGSDGRRNTIQCIDSTMLARANHVLGCTRSKPSQGSVPDGLALASDFSFCFHCEVDWSLVLRRPIEITAVIGHVEF